MGDTELGLLLKYGVPLAVKLLSAGKDEQETVDTVTNAIEGMATGDVGIEDALLAADKEQAKSIIDGLFGVITGVGDAFGGLLKAIVGLLR